MKKMIVRKEVELGNALSELPLILQKVYRARGVNNITELETGLQHILNFKNLKDIEKAQDRLFEALVNQQRVLIIGDFDADGATSTALAVSALKALGFQQVDYLVPNRFEQGYGLSVAIVEEAALSKPNLIITVDNGIASIDGVERANSLGIDVLITDHHLSADQLPNAIAIINPNQPGCQFESKNIAGVGVIFYVMLALRSKLREEKYFELQGKALPNMGAFLDLVALGTVADVVALDKNNRALVAQGLNRIRAGQCRPGLKALVNIAKRDLKTLQAMDLGFAVGPRLNAAGRLEDMRLGIECLLANTDNTAQELAAILDDLNIERRQIEAEMKQEAFQVIQKLQFNDKQKMPLGLCLYDANWHQGVIGIVAGRLKEKYHRPAIVFAEGDEQFLKGSARSIAKVHIRDILDAISKKHPTLIEKFGGHAMAAGLTIHKSHLAAFRQAFREELTGHMSEEDCIGQLYSDGELSEQELNLETATVLEQAGPWGQAFPRPLFDNEFELIDQRLLGGKHLKMSLRMDGSHQIIDAIAFNVSDELWPNHRARRIHCAYYLDVNRYQGRTRLQLMVEHLEPV